MSESRVKRTIREQRKQAAAARLAIIIQRREIERLGHPSK